MLLYELTEEADADIRAIAHYTISTWGIEQTRRYEVLLEKHLFFCLEGRKRFVAETFQLVYGQFLGNLPTCILS